MTDDRVTVPTDVMSRLVNGLLYRLWSSGCEVPCWRHCCGPCRALAHLFDSGQLDRLLRRLYERDAASVWPWFNGKDRRLDRAWLARVWRDDCPLCMAEPGP